MARLQSTETFNNGTVLTASALTNHVIQASPLPDFIGLQTALTTPASDDEFLVNDVNGAAVKKVTLANIAANLPSSTIAELTVSTNATITGNANVLGNAIFGDTNTDQSVFNSTASFGASTTFQPDAPVTVLGNISIGNGLQSGTYGRTGTTLTVNKTGHLITNGETRYFHIENNDAISGSYAISYLDANTFSITVEDIGPTSGDISWYNKAITLEASIDGPIQGDIPVNVQQVNIENGDQFLIKDASDSNKLKTVPFFALPRLYGNVSIKSTDVTTVGATVSRSLGSGTATITKSSHGMRVGDVLYLKLTGTGTLANGWYDVKSVPTSSTFTIQTANTTALASVTLEWYSVSVEHSIGLYSAFKESTTGSDVVFNLLTEFANTNYAIIATFSRNDGISYGATCCNIIGATGFDKTTKQFSLTSNYTSIVEADGSMMFTLFGDV